ncbi:unnamed protein product [Brassica oleracea var. botrytis]
MESFDVCLIKKKEEALMCVTGSESLIVIVLSGITESGFKVCIIMYRDTFIVAGRDIPIVRRVIKVKLRIYMVGEIMGLRRHTMKKRKNSTPHDSWQPYTFTGPPHQKSPRRTRETSRTLGPGHLRVRDFLANPVPPRYPRVSNWRPRVVVCEKPFSTATRPPESSQPLFVVATNFNHNLLYLLIWFHAHRPNVELSTGFSETERVRPQEDRIIDSVRTEFLCPQLPTAGHNDPGDDMRGTGPVSQISSANSRGITGVVVDEGIP